MGGTSWDTYYDLLPRCAAALRNRNGPGDLDRAYILDIKYQLVKPTNNDMDEIIKLAQAAVDHNSRVPYFYYALTRSMNVGLSLRASKSGLQCNPAKLTPWLKHQLLWKASTSQANIGISSIRRSNSEKDYAEGMAFLSAALEDAKAFLKEAPPDHRHTLEVLEWAVVCTIAVEGDRMGENMEELSVSDAFHKS